jgi:hypothetical protein
MDSEHGYGGLEFRANVAKQAPVMVAASAASSTAGTGAVRQGNGAKVILILTS